MNADFDVVAAIGALFAGVFGYGKLNAKHDALEKRVDTLTGMAADVSATKAHVEDIRRLLETRPCISHNGRCTHE